MNGIRSDQIRFIMQVPFITTALCELESAFCQIRGDNSGTDHVFSDLIRGSLSTQSNTLPRSDFIRPCRVLLSSLFCCELPVGLVGRLSFLTIATHLINSCNRSSASARFFSCVLYFPALMTITPSLLMRRSFRFKRRCLYHSGSEDARILKRRCIADETLLTFWPPAPRARMAESSISSSGSVTFEDIFSTDDLFHPATIQVWLFQW